MWLLTCSCKNPFYQSYSTKFPLSYLVEFMSNAFNKLTNNITIKLTNTLIIFTEAECLMHFIEQLKKVLKQSCVVYLMCFLMYSCFVSLNFYLYAQRPPRWLFSDLWPLPPVAYRPYLPISEPPLLFPQMWTDAKGTCHLTEVNPTVSPMTTSVSHT